MVLPPHARRSGLPVGRVHLRRRQELGGREAAGCRAGKRAHPDGDTALRARDSGAWHRCARGYPSAGEQRATGRDRAGQKQKGSSDGVSYSAALPAEDFFFGAAFSSALGSGSFLPSPFFAPLASLVGALYS